MTPSVRKNFLSALYGGASATLLAPLLWLCLMHFQLGNLSSDLFTGLLVVAFFALISGPTLAVVVGFPLLMLYDKSPFSNPILFVAIGALISSFVFSFGFNWPLSQWRFYIYFFLLGAACSAVAVWRKSH